MTTNHTANSDAQITYTESDLEATVKAQQQEIDRLKQLILDLQQPRYRLSRWSDTWYVLEGGTNGADIEGTPEEWKAIAWAIRDRRPWEFKRVSLLYDEKRKEWFLYSPRNAMGDSDNAYMTERDMDALAVHIAMRFG